MKCESGHEYTLDELVGCQEEARYLLQYSVDWALVRVEENHPHAADMEVNSCEQHVLDLDFVFDSSQGLPERIFDFKKNRWRPGLVKKIREAYASKHPDSGE